MIFQSWGLLYAILQVLMTALQLNSVSAVLGANGVLNAFVGSSQMVLLGAVSVLFSIAIILIPFIASRLVRGEVGSTVFALVSAAGFYANAAAKTLLDSGSASHAASGAPNAMSDSDPSAGGGQGGSAASRGGGAGGGLLAESKPPTPTSSSVTTGSAGSAGEVGGAGAVFAG